LAEINWTRESELWLEDIYNYIAADDPHAAAQTIAKIYEKAQFLRTHPRLYLIQRSGDIDILGVFHGSLDIDRYFI
jgi:plasmid stabilization system protein ParE